MTFFPANRPTEYNRIHICIDVYAVFLCSVAHVFMRTHMEILRRACRSLILSPHFMTFQWEHIGLRAHYFASQNRFKSRFGWQKQQQWQQRRRHRHRRRLEQISCIAHIKRNVYINKIIFFDSHMVLKCQFVVAFCDEVPCFRIWLHIYSIFFCCFIRLFVCSFFISGCEPTR